MSQKITAYFVGGPADGMTTQFDDRPPDRVQATPEGQAQLERFDPPTLYSRNDLTGGVVMYVPCGSLLHDAFVHVLRSYAESKQLDKLSDAHNRVGG